MSFDDPHGKKKSCKKICQTSEKYCGKTGCGTSSAISAPIEINNGGIYIFL